MATEWARHWSAKWPRSHEKRVITQSVLDVLHWNESAIKFYKSLGVDYLPQWRNVIIGEKALCDLGHS
jgi:hypothetical protein